MAEKAKNANKERNGGRENRTYSLNGPLERAIDEVDRLLATGKIDLKLDFSDCRFITVDGLEWLEEMLLRAQSQGANVSFANVSPAVYKVFKVAHIDSVMKACGAPVMGPVC